MQKIKKLAQEIGVLSLSITIVFVLVVGITIVKGWTEPTALPPGGNLSAPINTGGIGQTKGGNLILNSLGTYITGLTVNKNLDVTGSILAENGLRFSNQKYCQCTITFASGNYFRTYTIFPQGGSINTCKNVCILTATGGTPHSNIFYRLWCASDSDTFWGGGAETSVDNSQTVPSPNCGW